MFVKKLGKRKKKTGNKQGKNPQLRHLPAKKAKKGVRAHEKLGGEQLKTVQKEEGTKGKKLGVTSRHPTEKRKA